MTLPKYKFGKQIRSISEFDQSECKYFKVFFGDKNSFQMKSRNFLISWQYRTLFTWIERGWIHEAEEIICGTGVGNA